MSFYDIMHSIKDRNFAHTYVWFFYCFGLLCAGFFFLQMGETMQLELIKNPDESQIAVYKAARVIYAETYPTTLPAVEALASMIKNIMTQSKKDLLDVVSDKNIFDSLNDKSLRHQYINADTKNNRAFQMCVRVVERMMHGGLMDSVFGATRFHHVNEMPNWATSIGYIADIDGLLFYANGEPNVD